MNSLRYSIDRYVMAVTAVERSQPGYFADLREGDNALCNAADEVEYNLSTRVLYTGE